MVVNVIFSYFYQSLYYVLCVLYVFMSVTYVLCSVYCIYYVVYILYSLLFTFQYYNNYQNEIQFKYILISNKYSWTEGRDKKAEHE